MNDRIYRIPQHKIAYEFGYHDGNLDNLKHFGNESRDVAETKRGELIEAGYCCGTITQKWTLNNND